ncbi:MAG: HlyC/CorC family transporter [Desulfovibrionaceae bacterium]|nr:HlyC/CorC family transporter [Desulfovibrionaceae bacterium]MBF0514907.1 HlyC/CorC family transporter [Desulfovibrionaceae bacterium]
MTTLVLTATLAIVTTFFCSLCEAVLYATPWSLIERLRREGRPCGQILFDLRMNIDRPIAAILTLNTVAATVGASVCGAAAVTYFESDILGLFTAAFTAAILVLGEIIPKTIGVEYSQRLAPLLARPFLVMVRSLAPVIWLLGLVTRLIQPKKKGPPTTEEDIRSIVSLTRKAGVIKPYEELAIQNILTLDRKIVAEIMTPRTVVFSLAAEMTVKQAREARPVWPHSRIPVYQGDDPEQIVGIVYRRQVLETLANDQDDTRLEAIMRPVQFVLDTLTLDRLLVKFLESRTHLFIALDEYGGVSGAVTLEDVLEEILGKEIVDETDQVADMRELARTQRTKLLAEAAETSKE